MCMCTCTCVHIPLPFCPFLSALTLEEGKGIEVGEEHEVEIVDEEDLNESTDDPTNKSDTTSHTITSTCVCMSQYPSLSDTHMYTYLTQLMTVVFPVLIDPSEDSGLRHRLKTQTSMPELPGKLHMYIVG